MAFANARGGEWLIGKRKMPSQSNQQQLVEGFFSLINRQYAPDDANEKTVFNEKYYTDVHASNAAYQRNNWFSDKFIELVAKRDFATIFELGSGNGKATQKLAQICDKVIACDWSPNPYSTHEKVEFHNCSFFDLPSSIQADVTISADVIEHFPPDKLYKLMGRLDHIAPYGLHIIAGYADGHSHLSVYGPWDWLKMFRHFDSNYKLVEIEARRDNWETPVFVFSNFL